MPVADVLEAVQDHIDRAGDYDLYRDYEEGRQAAPYASVKFREKFGWILEQARMNVCYTVRSNFTDLVQIQGWSGAGAKAAADLAETSDLDMAIDLAVNEAFRCGDGYILAWPGADGTLRPWYHRADQVAFKLDPENPGAFEWVAKLWVDADDHGHVNVYYPHQLERWVTVNKVRNMKGAAPSWKTDAGSYVPASDDEDGTRGDVVPYAKLGITDVPWVHIPFDPQSQGGHGRSILRDVIPLQDGLNHAVHAAIINTEKYAAPIRALMNYQADVIIDPATGQPKESKLDLDETRNSIFGVKGGGPLTQLDPPDSANILNVKRDWITDVAVTAGMPISDIAPDLGNIPSGVSLRVLATRRTNTLRAFNASIRGRIGLLMGLLGVPDAFPEFADTAPMDDTERLSNAQARLDMGYPFEEVLPDLGEDSDDILRILALAAAQDARTVRAFRAAQEDPEVMGSGVA